MKKPDNFFRLRGGTKVRYGWRKCTICNPEGLDMPQSSTCSHSNPCRGGWREYVIRRAPRKGQMNGHKVGEGPTRWQDA